MKKLIHIDPPTSKSDTNQGGQTTIQYLYAKQSAGFYDDALN